MGSTRDRLLDEAERLFARSSIAGVTSRQIIEAADQRNQSAVSYHFGSREGLLAELLARRGGPVDVRRGEMRSELGDRPEVADLVRCLVDPYLELLDSESGRSYVRIVAQLRGRFAVWRVESDSATTTHLAGVLDELERRPALPAAIRRERVVAMIVVLTSMAAERARLIDEGVTPELSEDEMRRDLVDMCTAVLLAPRSRS